MPLLLRRGTNAERLLITPQEGELIYTTDTQQLFVGDGTTLGGNTISTSLLGGTLTGDLNLGGFEINGVGNVAIIGSVTSSNGFTGSVFSNSSDILVDAVNGLLLGPHYGPVTGDLQGSVFGNDSTVIIDGNARAGFFNMLVGNLIGSVFSDDSSTIIDGGSKNANFNNVNAFSVVSDLIGSVFADDSTVIVDSISRTVSTNNLNYQSVLNINSTQSGISNLINLKSTGESQLLKFIREDTGTTSDQNIGIIAFDQIDDTGTKTYFSLSAWHSGVYMGISSTGSPTTPNYVSIVDGSLILGGFTPTEKLDVRGNGVFEGFVQFGSLTTTERNALTAANGMVIYNSTANRFQGYQNGGWINLDDGTAA